MKKHLNQPPLPDIEWENVDIEGLCKHASYADRYADFASLLSDNASKAVCLTYQGGACENITLRLILPPNVKEEIKDGMMKMPRIIDFNGLTIELRDGATGSPTPIAKHIWLFNILRDSTPVPNVALFPRQVDNGQFKDTDGIDVDKRYHVVLKDSRLWTSRYDTVKSRLFYRKDILLIEKGVSKNLPIAPYATPSTDMEYEVYELDSTSVILKNLKFVRIAPDLAGNVRTIGLVRVEGHDRVVFQNIEVSFDQPITTGMAEVSREEPFWKNPRRAQDGIFKLKACTNVCFDNIKVEGTYSLPNEYGYAFDLDNIYNLRFTGVQAQGIWGVFGTNCLNGVYIGPSIIVNENKVTEVRSRINRFDIHCYGRDVRIEKTDFVYDYQHTDGSKQYNQISSFFGVFSYHDCSFNKISPLLFEDSYHIYTPFQLKMTECRFVQLPNDRSLIKVGPIGVSDNLRSLLREDLRKIYWPDVSVTGLVIEQDTDSSSPLTVFYVRTDSSAALADNPIYGISVVEVFYECPGPGATLPPVRFSNLANIRNVNTVSTVYNTYNVVTDCDNAKVSHLRMANPPIVASGL